jgi:hypothetical protein
MSGSKPSFRLVRQAEIAYISETGRPYGAAEPPRMSWPAPRGHLFRGGWEPVDMGAGNQALAEKVRSFLVRLS